MATNRPTKSAPATPDDPNPLVRVRDENGHEWTTTATRAAKLKLAVINKPATDREGRPLPPKSRGTAQTAGNAPDGAAPQAANQITA